jgi:pantoate--beta-alanine ligase
VPLLSSDRQSLTVVETIAEVRQLVEAARERGARIGLVPTMGALHAGHISLIEAARRECDFVVVTIFVNPTQFGPHEDFQKYPRSLEADARLCAEAGAAAIFHPATSLVYPPGFASFIEVAGLSDVLEGRFRPGHFRGVATVVLKLFQMAPADRAYFGQKDYQQQTIIRRMCVDLNLPIEIRVCPTVREPDGLALSSRNVYLNSDERRSALALSRSLELGRQLLGAGDTDLNAIRRKMLELLDATPLVRPDYVTLIHPETLEEFSSALPKLDAVVAARVG